jgi:hypothetical protein
MISLNDSMATTTPAAIDYGNPMCKMSKFLILGFVLALICLPPLHAQRAYRTPANPSPAPPQAPADNNPMAANPTTAGQAPDDMTNKITDLYHNGKYAEAQQLTTGLLVAYPDDQRLIRAKALLEKLLAPAGSATATLGSNQPTSNAAPAQPATNTNAGQLSGRERLDYDALIELARQAQESADVEQQKASLQQFMDESRVFLQKHPDQMLLWQLRAASAISLNDPMAGYEAGQKLLAAGAADSNDSNLRRLLGQLKNKGWMDRQGVAEARQKIAEGEKYDWLIGTWQGTSSWFSKAAFDYGKRQANMKVEFIKSGSGIEGYVYNQNTGAPFKVPGLKYTARNVEEINLPTNWKSEWKKEWRPISSFTLSSDKKTMTIVYQSVETRTLVLTKVSD